MRKVFISGAISLFIIGAGFFFSHIAYADLCDGHEGADLNCDDKVDEKDFIAWKDAFISGDAPLSIFETWRRRLMLTGDIDPQEPPITNTNTPQNAADVTISVANSTKKHTVSKDIWGGNIPAKNLQSSIADFEEKRLPLSRLEEMGISNIRFPNGCHADGFSWKDSKVYRIANGEEKVEEHMNIATAIELTNTIGADFTYVINVEYNKAIGNPCGDRPNYPGHDDPQKNLDILVQDAKELVQRYGTDIKLYELGNEPWGFWEAADYVEKAKLFAREMKSVNPQIKIAVVGFPTSGNNMNPEEKTDDKDKDWTNKLTASLDEKCGNVPCFDIVTDHSYNLEVNIDIAPVDFPGRTAYYTSYNPPRAFQSRINDYTGKGLGLTEYNIICWGERWQDEWTKMVSHGFYSYYMLMGMARENFQYAHWHELSKSTCGVVNSDDSLATTGYAFKITSPVQNSTYIDSHVDGPITTVPEGLFPDCNNTKCLKGGEKIPDVDSYVFDKNGTMYLYLSNKHPTKSYDSEITFADTSKLSAYTDITQTSHYTDDYTKRRFDTETEDLTLQNNRIRVNLKPISINIIKLE